LVVVPDLGAMGLVLGVGFVGYGEEGVELPRRSKRRRGGMIMWR
jgi:hypothetical protein